jgi:hypothetical protein
VFLFSNYVVQQIEKLEFVLPGDGGNVDKPFGGNVGLTFLHVAS